MHETRRLVASEAVLSKEVQQALARWNKERLAPGSPGDGPSSEYDLEMREAEGNFVDALREEIAPLAAAAPLDPLAFVRWYEDLRQSGPGQNDLLFPWLATQASKSELRWFFEQEAAGEAGFDDLVAMTQVKLPAQAKLELARNYWDEMGRGNGKGMHGPMLSAVADALDVTPTIEGTIPESLALANAMTAMATRRDYAWHSVGALGAIELTAPTRAGKVAAGIRRVGLNGRLRHYFDLHSVLDVKHSAAWVKEVITPLVAEDPRRARWIGEGALMRLRCGERCYARYREHLWAPPVMRVKAAVRSV